MVKGRSILIVDDDQAEAEQLRNMLRKYTDGRHVFCVQTGEQAMEIIETEGTPEMIFVDVSLNGEEGARSDKDGIVLAKELQHHAPAAEVIFVSGYDDYYLDVYEVDHIWFLRKPVSEELLEMAVDRVREKTGEGRMFTFTWARTEYVIPYREILYFEKKRRKVLLYREDMDAPYEFYSTMDELRAMLPEYFFRCHNSYVVNLRKVRQYSRTSFDVGGHHVPISRVYEKKAREVFYDFLEHEA